jgi:hypothetical protein
MNLITIKETKRELQNIWPNLRTRVPTDREFYIPEIGFLMDQLKITHSGLPSYKPNKFACEEFAFGSWFLLHKYRTELGEDTDKDHNIHYGVLFGTSFKNAIGPHWNNFSITTDGLYIIDFDSMQHWKPTTADVAKWGFE